MSPQQVALAWELSLADVVIPIPGASRPASIEDSVRAADLELDDDELAALAHRDDDPRAPVGRVTRRLGQVLLPHVLARREGVLGRSRP